MACAPGLAATADLPPTTEPGAAQTIRAEGGGPEPTTPPLPEVA